MAPTTDYGSYLIQLCTNCSKNTNNNHHDYSNSYSYLAPSTPSSRAIPLMDTAVPRLHSYMCIMASHDSKSDSCSHDSCVALGVLVSSRSLDIDSCRMSHDSDSCDSTK